MATNPMLQAVLRFQHHLTTTPSFPLGTVRASAPQTPPTKEKPSPEKQSPPPDTEDDDDDEEEKSKKPKKEGEGERHG